MKKIAFTLLCLIGLNYATYAAASDIPYTVHSLTFGMSINDILKMGYKAYANTEEEHKARREKYKNSDDFINSYNIFARSYDEREGAGNNITYSEVFVENKIVYGYKFYGRTHSAFMSIAATLITRYGKPDKYIYDDDPKKTASMCWGHCSIERQALDKNAGILEGFTLGIKRSLNRDIAMYTCSNADGACLSVTYMPIIQPTSQSDAAKWFSVLADDSGYLIQAYSPPRKQLK